MTQNNSDNPPQRSAEPPSTTAAASSSNETPVYDYKFQWRFVLLIEIFLVLLGTTIFFIFWGTVCDEDYSTCLATGPITGPLTFFLICLIRPFVFTPLMFVAYIGGGAFGIFWGTLLTAIFSLGSCGILFGLGKVLGRRMVKPWLAANLPATWKFLRSQDYKIVFGLRLLPVIPFDLLSILFGAVNFRTKSVMIATFIGILPECYLVARFGATASGGFDAGAAWIQTTIETLLIICAMTAVPLLIFEFLTRKKGGGLWMRTKAMYHELAYEVKANNEIVKRFDYDSSKTPVLLLYGFFSSRRSMTVLERLLVSKGHQVMSFNLGGLLGTFFTRGIIETAAYIDYKIKRQIDRHGFNKIQVVAHSKGGMVALWWALKMGGSQYCDQIITMGTPFKGSRFTYLALVTPVGFFFKDVWQMRPGSRFLQGIHDLSVPDHLKIYCLHSKKDNIAKGKEGLFKPAAGAENVISVPINNVTHYEFLYRRHVGDIISKILTTGDPEGPSADSRHRQTG